MDLLLAGLNPAQRAAVEHGEGPLLVLAGPGSGKTRVITYRVAHLIRVRNVPANRILAVTFTNKAAGEMRRRILEFVGDGDPWIHTFHSFCTRLLRRHAELAGLSNRFSILDERDRTAEITAVVKDLDGDPVHFPPEGIGKRISQLQNELVSPEEFAAHTATLHDRLVAQVYDAYARRLKSINAVDFDGLLYLVAEMLEKHPEVRERLDGRFQHILVDEYQDTNYAQYAIARRLSQDVPNICATGDPDQSIYSWRGADLGNILRFESDYPGATVVRLEQNYRSTAMILSAADHLIRHNRQRKHKELVTENPEGVPVVVYCHKDDAAEAGSAAEFIRAGVDEGEFAYCDVAVLVRTAALSRSFETAFGARGIPFQVVGGISFFDRKEVKDVLAIGRLILNPRDDAAFRRAVASVADGVGSTTMGRLDQFAKENYLSLREAGRRIDQVAVIRGKPKAALADFTQLLDELDDVLMLPPRQALELIIARSRYLDQLEKLSEEERKSAVGVVSELLDGADGFASEMPGADFSRFLDAVSLMSKSDEGNDASDKTSIMTLHAAKGLEFDVVFMPAFEHDILPHERSVQEGNEEEERRLVFVGMTRARKQLILSHARRRMIQGRLLIPSPSMFLLELPHNALDRRDVVIPVQARGGSTIDFDESQESPYEEPSIQIVRGAPKSSTADGFRRGMWVQHPQYGQGMILQLEGTGSDRMATVQFSSVGPRRFVLNKSPLQPV